MSNLGQFNLIVGDNNVGKTSVLEALLFDEELAPWRSNLLNTLNFRNFFGDKSNLQPTDLKDAEIWSLLFKKIGSSIVIATKGEVNLQITLSLVSYANLSDSEKEIVKERVINPIPQLWLKQCFQDNSTSRQPHLVTAYFEDNTYWEYSTYMPFIPVNLSYGDDLVGFFYDYINVDKLLKKELESNLSKLIPSLEEIRVHRFFQNS